MNNRQKDLLRILLLHKEGALQIKDLAEELECAEKTVRNDLDRLEEFLQDYPNVKLSRRPGFGILAEISEEDRANIFQNLFSNEPKKGKERLFEIAYELLTSQKAITLQSLAEHYYLPKAAIKKDLEAITIWLQRFDLELVSKQRLGHAIQGSELQKRNALARLSEFTPSNPVEKNDVLNLFLPYEISMIKKALIDMRNKFSIPFTEEALEGLQVHALIMLKRTRQRSPVFIQEAEKERIYERKEYQYAKWFFEQLEPVFRVAFSEEEQIYFTWHLISSKRIGEEAGQVTQHDEETVQVVLTFMDKMSKLTLVDFMNDSTLTSGLFVHMHSVINRIRYGFPIINPLLYHIKKMYPYMFNMVILTLEEIKQSYHLDIPEDEAAYLTLHFQASIERMESKKDIRKKALIVCHLGMGMSYLLEAKIEQQYQGIEIVACIGKAEVLAYIQRSPVDFIISTMPLEKSAVEHLVISPLFGQEDQKQLNQFVDKLKRKGTHDRQSAGITSILSEELLFMDVDYEHRYEVVEMLADSLFKRGYAEKEFIHSAVSRERMSATAIGGAIAIPHGNPSLIKRSAIAAAILRKPLDWGNEQVSVVFLLAISKEDHKEIRGIIGKIASLSESPAIVHKLVQARDQKEFLQLLEEKESE
ncbi:BglG family transcription antiterminator [Niallia sp. NCCP-28]|uniref:BglG family transcription antiterminator n=1 Tax=Niallia sp. NCCP-28 TaxID=2934712 RepID=UPI00208B265B|nr:BglG family transcription antiterminator [Niallia sp. NCCP-28]GKU84868.1 transcriptional regulator ManR [Niallia sp. NCCP-28]